MQDALLRLHRLDSERIANSAAYTRGIVVTEYLGWRRRRWSTELVVGPETIDVPALQGDAAPGSSHHLAIDDVLCAIGELSACQRTVLVLCYYEDLCDAEIGALVGCSAATVRSVAARALARVHQVMPSSLTATIGEEP